MSEKVQRKLAAIVAADVVGYSRLMGADETGTISALSSLRSEVIDPLINGHGGRIVKIMGDGLLLEFHSIIAATEFALATQESNIRRNANVADETVMRLRIGVHIGDVIIDGEDILGDGVNIAARIEPLAKPDGVSLSDDAYRQVRDRISVMWEDGGKHEAKNIVRPIQIWHWVNATQHAQNRAPEKSAKPKLPDKPSIAVLPFENMSTDPEHGYLGDGLAEDVITTLSKISSLFVIARNSSFAFKNKSMGVQEIASELGVRYILEGSVRSSGKRLRISVQLIDAIEGHHLWAERFDRQLQDVFDIQDEMTREIVTALRLELSDGEQSQVWLRGTDSFNVWLKTMQALELVMRGSPATITQARELLQSAFDADPNYTFALAWIGLSHWLDARFGFSESPEKSLAESERLANLALKNDALEPHAHNLAGAVLAVNGQYDEAVKEMRKAVELSPNDAFLKVGLARTLIIAGRSEEAEVPVREAMRLNPYYPNYYRGVLANALEELRRDEEAIDVLSTAIEHDPNYFSGHLRLASLFGLANRFEEAKIESEEVLRINPRFDLSRAASFYPTANPKSLERFVAGLRIAGIRE